MRGNAYLHRFPSVTLAVCLVTILLPLGADCRSVYAQSTGANPSVTGVSEVESSSDDQADPDVQDTGDADFRALVRSSILLVKERKYNQAIALLEPHRTKDDYSMLHALGIAYLRTERNQEAYETLLRAHRVNPADAAPLLPAALACARMAKTCTEYRQLALVYKAQGGKLVRFADRIANFQPVTLQIRSKDY